MGQELEQWHRLLVPTISCFVAAFDDPDSEENKGFWQKIVKEIWGSSGPFILLAGSTLSVSEERKGAICIGRLCNATVANCLWMG